MDIGDVCASQGVVLTMPQRSAIQLLAVLQAHGLSLAMLELMVRHCESAMTGHMQLHTVDGTILSYDVRATGKVATLRYRPEQATVAQGVEAGDPSRGPGLGTALRRGGT